MVTIENNQACFVVLWRKLERTRRLLTGQYKRFCIRNVLKAWFGYEADDDFIWEVCRVPLVRAGRLERTACTFALSAQTSRTIKSDCGGEDGHQLLENQSESPR